VICKEHDVLKVELLHLGGLAGLWLGEFFHVQEKIKG